MKKLHMLLFLMLPITLLAQNFEKGVLSDFRNKRLAEGLLNKSLSYTDINGSPYLVSDFSRGNLITSDNILYTDVPMRYDMYSDELEFQKDSEVLIMDPKTIIKRAEFGNRTFTCVKFAENGDKIATGIMEIIAEGRATLFLRHTIKFLPREPEKAYAESKPPRFDQKQESYYLSIDGQNAKKIQGNKSFTQLFPGKEKEVDEYCKKNKLSSKNPEHLKKVVDYYNTL